jgi:hypothetical protein
MTRIVLEIPQDKDLDMLLALFSRLNIRVIDQSEVAKLEAKKLEEKASFILKGLPARKDFDDFLRDFESSRADLPLPGREN